MSIAIEKISKHFGAYAALGGIDLTIDDGALVALLGPSGSGKTTLLRILAGLEYPDRDGGRVLFDGVDVTRATPAQRRIGLVFQHYALFQHLTVRDNIAFGLEIRRGRARVGAAARAARVQELLERVQLDGLADRYPSQLSGGQRQRVGLARALAIEPRVLLLDEPFGALDARVRQDLRRWLRRLHDDLHPTTVFVTHDQEEALEMADRLVVMHQGHIQQVGSSKEVYDRPANAFVCEFLGRSNVIDARTDGAYLIIDGVRFPHARTPQTGDVRTYLRPHDIELLATANGHAALRATVHEVQVIGPIVRVVLRRVETGDFLEVHLTRQQVGALNLQAGDQVFARPTKLTVFPASQGRKE